MVWDKWALDRVIILVIGLGYLLLWIQVTMLHYRQNFHNKAMWEPVLLAPIICLASVVSTLANSSGWYVLSQILFWLGAISGLIGFYFHFRGVGLRVGGYALRNFLTGPPVVLPLLFSALSILGLIAVYGG